MSFSLRQALLIAGTGFLVIGMTAWLVRRKLLSLRYAAGWMFVGGLAVVGSIGTPLVEPIADLFGMSPTGVLLGVATVTFLVIAVQLSISVSGLQSQLRDVAESAALLGGELEELRPGRSVES